MAEAKVEGAEGGQASGVRGLPRNVWAVSATSFFMDISSEMVINLLPLFLANVLGVRTGVIGVIEGGAVADDASGITAQTVSQGSSGGAGARYGSVVSGAVGVEGTQPLTRAAVRRHLAR